LYWVTQENSIESSLQNSLPYILLQMIHTRDCASYPKWPYVKHEANIWCSYCMTLFCSRTFYSLLLSSVINVVTTLSDVTDMTVWPITSNPNPRVLKIEKWKINQKENKRKLSLLSAILIVITNFIQLVPPQPVDQFSQTKLLWKAPNEGYPHICGMYKSNNKWLRYQAISSFKSFVCQYLMNGWTDSHDWACVGKCSSICFQRSMMHLKATSIGRDTSISM